MRVLLEIIVGIVLTIGGAYIHDSNLPGGSNQRLVNWNAAADLSGWAIDRAREEWTKLTSK